jgi:hypothetical protein
LPVRLFAVAIAVAAADGRGDTVTAQFPTGERTLTVVGTYDNRALLGDRLVE